MKHKRTKKFIKLGILLFGVPLLFFTCIKDEPILETLDNQKPTFNITIEPYEHLKTENQNLALKIDKLIEGSDLKRSDTSQEYGFTINDNNVQVMELDNFTTYTFLIFRDNPEPNILENYVYKESHDGSYEQFILRYAYSIDENDNRIYDTSYLDIELINDDNLLLNKAGCEPEFVEVLDGFACTSNTRCTGDGHEVGDDCSCDNTPQTCYRAGSTVCEATYSWIYQGCSGGNPTDGDSDGTDNPNDDTSNNGGGNGDADNDNELEDWEIPAVPFEDLTEKEVQKECQKIDAFLDNNPNFKTLLLGLNNDLNLNFEKSIMKFENVDNIIVDQGTPDQAEVRLVTVQGYIYEAYAHTHYETTTTPEGDTYSVFSMDDLLGTARIIDLNLADTNSFVIFLPTGKGTHYAMTINDKARFLKFFYYKLNEGNPPSNLNELTEYLDSRDFYLKLEQEFYTSKNAIIKTSNDDNDQVLKAFLKFMQEADMGTTLFKTDENFNDFTRVSYDNTLINGEIKEQTCND